MERITDLNMSMQDAIIVLSGGNPGALTVLMETSQKMNMMDFFFKVLLKLDGQGIHEDKIWDLYKRDSGEDIDLFIKNVAKI